MFRYSCLSIYINFPVFISINTFCKIHNLNVLLYCNFAICKLSHFSPNSQVPSNFRSHVHVWKAEHKKRVPNFPPSYHFQTPLCFLECYIQLPKSQCQCKLAINWVVKHETSKQIHIHFQFANCCDSLLNNNINHSSRSW